MQNQEMQNSLLINFGLKVQKYFLSVKGVQKTKKIKKKKLKKCWNFFS